MVDQTGIDLLALIRADVPLKRQSAHGGGEYHGPCPFCGGLDRPGADRFMVWPVEGRYWCRRCGRNGDAVAYVQQRHNCSFAEACLRLGLSPARGDAHPRPSDRGRVATRRAAESAGSRLPPPRASRETERGPLGASDAVPPSTRWQARGLAFTHNCADRLWSSEGRRALAWLTATRGLSEETIRAAGLGFNPTDRYESPAAWGLPPAHKRVWLPRGITIPWLDGELLWRVNIRRPAGSPKYIGPAGFGSGLYGAPDIVRGRPVILLEGEFDAQTVVQAAPDLATAVATGSTCGSRGKQWIDLLRHCSMVLVAFDSDEAGEAASAYWMAALPNAIRWRPPYTKDVNDMAALGGDIRVWLAAGFRSFTSRLAHLRPDSPLPSQAAR